MVDFSNFRRLDPEMAEAARGLIHAANRKRSPFNSFMNTWLVFNGWMESVTESESDAQMITALAENRRMNEFYDFLCERYPAFRSRAKAFAELWPVVSVRDVRKKLGHEAFWQMDRNTLLEECRRNRVKIQPLEWEESDLPTWPQMLKTIYLIRCNLFHGAKSPHNPRDRDLVERADRILRTYIRKSGCFDW